MKHIIAFLFLALTGTTAWAENWQHRLPDNTFISVVSIPGSHDSATGGGWEEGMEGMGDQWARTQELTIAEQWTCGVRAFDLRPCVYEEYMNLNHGIIPTRLHFEDVMLQLRDSLVQNPSEFIIIHMLHEKDGDQVSDAYNSRIVQFLKSDPIKDYLIDYKRGLTVGDMRGKILLLSRDNATHTNAFIVDYLRSNPAGPTGIIMMDYAGVDETNGYATQGKALVEAIIANNFGYLDDVLSVATPQVSGSVSTPIYDLTGRSIARPTRGIYIQGGRKHIVR